MRRAALAFGPRAQTVAFAAIVAAGALACEQIIDPSGHVTSVVLRLPHDSLFLGKSVSAVAVATGDSATVAAPRFTWSSSDTNVAVVDSLGTILAVGVGTATIAAELKGERDEFTIRGVLPRSDNGVEFDIGSTSEPGGGVCAVSVGGRVFCAPSNATDSIRAFTLKPRGENITFTSIYTGSGNQCGIDADGVIYCWGENFDYILATRFPTRTDTAPLPVATPLRFSSMSAGGHAYVCGVERVTDVVHCWGHGHADVLGRATTPGSQSGADSMVTPVTDSLRAKLVATGNVAACALDLAGKVFCWGLGAPTLGVPRPPFPEPPAPRPLPGDMSFSALAVAREHACALTADGIAFCWGRNYAGQLGLGHADPVQAGPHAVATDLRFASIYALQSGGACGITMDSDVYCWGTAPPFAVTQRMARRSYAPYRVASGAKFRALTLGWDFTCGITLARALVCW